MRGGNRARGRAPANRLGITYADPADEYGEFSLGAPPRIHKLGFKRRLLAMGREAGRRLVFQAGRRFVIHPTQRNRRSGGMHERR